MNILKHEWKANLKVFLFWILGLFLLVFTGMTKFTGIAAATGGEDINKILNQFPKVILAVLGISGVDISTLAGYYTILAFYALICGAIYAIHLGNNAVSREKVDKTYEFIFTKPCTKTYVLGMKVIAGWMALAAFSIFNLLFSYGAVAALKFDGNINKLILLYTIVLFLFSSLFYSVSIFLATIARRAEKGALYSNLCFLFAFIMGVIYDMLDNGRIIKLISPMKYFEAKDLIAGKFDLGFLILCIILITILTYAGFRKFQRSELI